MIHPARGSGGRAGRLEPGGPSPSHRLITLLGGLAFASLGLEIAIVSFAVLGMRQEWGLSAQGVAVVIAAPGVGQLFGAVGLGGLSDRLGRRLTYALSVGLLAGFTALAALSPAPWAACVLLFLGGLGQGGAAPVITSMVAEAAPKTSRGRMVAVTEVMWACGFTIAALLGRPLAQGADWRLLMAIGGVPLLLAPIGLRLLPAASSSPASSSSAGQEEGSRMVPTASAGSLTNVWRRPLRVQTAILWLLWITMFSIFSGPVIFLPTLFATAGDTDAAAKGLFVSLGILAGACAVLLVIDRVGRRPLLVGALGFMAVFCTSLAFGRTDLWLVLSGVGLGFVMQFNWPVALTYATEVYPTSIRGVGVGWALGAGRVGTFAAPVILGSLLVAYGRLPAILVFGALALSVAALVAWAGPETAGREFDRRVTVPTAAL